MSSLTSSHTKVVVSFVVGAVAVLFLFRWIGSAFAIPEYVIDDQRLIAAATEMRQDFAVRKLLNDQKNQIWTFMVTSKAADAEQFSAALCGILKKHGALAPTTKVRLVSYEDGTQLIERTCSP